MTRCNTELDEKDSGRYVMKCHVEKLKESHKKFYGVIANLFQPWRKITENQQKVVNTKTMIR